MINEQSKWLLILSTLDRPGDTAAIASIFSGRGIQIDSFLGYGNNSTVEGESNGTIMIAFNAYPERKQMMCQLLESIQAVTNLTCYLYSEAPQDLIVTVSRLKQRLSTQQKQGLLKRG